MQSAAVESLLMRADFTVLASRLQMFTDASHDCRPDWNNVLWPVCSQCFCGLASAALTLDVHC